MIITDVFQNDTNTDLKYCQHELYGQQLEVIFLKAKNKFIFADRLFSLSDSITNKLKEIDGFDHRVLQDAHDIIAAYYRYQLEDEGKQLKLFQKNIDLHDYYKRKWREWFEHELDELSNNPQFVRAVIESIVLQNTEPGYLAEYNLCVLLIIQYSMVDWAYTDGYIKAYEKPHSC